jgi:hypothetical protein
MNKNVKIQIMKTEEQKYTRDEIVVEVITWTAVALILFFAN